MRPAMAPIAIILVTFLTFLSVTADSEKVQVDIYYEALCPWSAKFIISELYPSYGKVADYIHVNFVPYGFATWKQSNESERKIFSCQHGPRECQGNREMACAIHELEKSEISEEDRQNSTVQIVSCAMQAYKVDFQADVNIAQCGKKSGLTDEAIQSIKSCANSSVGDDLLIAYGEKSSALRPKLVGVPTIILNGESSSKAQGDFLGAICAKLPDGTKPPDCGGKFSEFWNIKQL